MSIIRLLLATILVAACSASGPAAATTSRPAAATTSACESAVAAAAAIDDMSDTVSDLDPAIRNCATIEDLRAAAAKYPKAFDGVDPVEFVRNRCASSSGPTAAGLCSLVK